MISNVLKKINEKINLLLIILLVLLVTFLFFQYKIWFGSYSYSNLEMLKEDISEKKEENKKLSKINSKLEEEKKKLNSGREAIEGLARSELGLIKPGETFYSFKSEESKDQEDRVKEGDR